jgi:20S proteasome subunit beta 2
MMPNKGGFDFEFAKRNSFLEQQGKKMPTAKKTGTTIVGVVFDGGVCLGADTRATEGPIVADKNCEKIHYIAPNIYCCGAGTSADTENTTALISSKLALHRLATGRPSRIATALTMLKQMLFRYQGHVSAALVLGGVDLQGPHLHTIYPHGSTDELPYVTMGSGSLAAMAIFEAHYKKNMTKEEAIKIVHEAILSGIYNDLGSGGNVDITVITADGVEIRRTHDAPNARKYRRPTPYVFPPGTVPVLSEKQVPLSARIVVTDDTGSFDPNAMVM